MGSSGAGAGERGQEARTDVRLEEALAQVAALTRENARLRSEAAGAGQAKADFLAVISHELRTPLTAIIGYAELLSLGVPEPVTQRQKEQVERIEAAGHHLMQLIEEVLTMASLETGQIRVRSERVDVGELVRQAADAVRSAAHAKGLELRIDVAQPDLAVSGDPDKLLQVMLSLLDNAVKFTESGEVRIWAGLRSGELHLEVSDTGVGIDPRLHERIFEPFWQAEQPITRRVGGTGLGLAISRGLVELMGGRIEVRSHPGDGASFVVRLPGG
jgi:signal transduction histidine kinase